VANLKVKNAFLLRNCIHNKYCLLCKGKNIVKYNCDWEINVNWFFWWGKLCQAKKNFISLKTFFYQALICGHELMIYQNSSHAKINRGFCKYSLARSQQNLCRPFSWS